MLLIPVGAEEDGSRAQPVVTIALIVLNVVWFLWWNVLPMGASWKAEVAAASKDVDEYWTAHPNLTPPESLARLLGPEEMEEELARVKAATGQRNPEMAWLDEISRKELDRRVTVLEEALAQRPLTRFGFVPARPSALGALTSLFTHGGLFHLVGNMLFLWATGPFVEAVLGPFAFLVFYLCGGLAATATQWLASGNDATPLVGASGAIAAVMGALLVRNAAAKIRFLFMPILWAPRLRFLFGVPALVVLPLWFVEQVASARVDVDAPVAWWAHVGGFAFGMAAGGALWLFGRKTRRPSRVVAAPARPRVAAASVPAPRPAPVPVPRREAAPPPRPSVEPRPGGSVSFVRAQHGSAWLRLAVVSTNASGEVVITREGQPVLRRALARVSAGALAIDQQVELREGPLDLRVELRLDGAPPRVTSVVGILKKGDARVLRIEQRLSGLAAELR